MLVHAPLTSGKPFGAGHSYGAWPASRYCQYIALTNESPLTGGFSRMPSARTVAT